MLHASRRAQKGISRGRAAILLVALLAGAGMWFLGGQLFGPPAEEELTLEQARATANPVPDSPAVLAEAKALFTEHCEHCHGEGGAGDGGDAQMYTPPPADFTRPGMASIRDGELFYKITEGRKPMPSFQHLLSSEQRWKLVRYIRTFAPRAVTP